MTEARSKHRTDGQATRERILEAAGELFAADGYAQTTASAIAGRAEVSLTLINYYFDGREGLYRAALIEAHRRLGKLSDLRDLAESELPATAKLRVLIYGLVRPATKRRPGWHINVLAKEIFAPSTHFPVLFEAEVPPKLAIIKQILSAITAIPVDDPALVRCVISVLAPCSMLLVAARGAPGPLDEVRRMPREAIITHLHTYALAGLEAIAREHGRRESPMSNRAAAQKGGDRRRPAKSKN
jgi:TetR/AcrR family transcriptional regulator, regulator of cefoperazone and chloramphenicol sensitivity